MYFLVFKLMLITFELLLKKTLHQVSIKCNLMKCFNIVHDLDFYGLFMWF
ncbi:Uncharacterised protein [Mycobacteroides abscessus subsp. massiliense]|nr:Uncharacterised protein [Mycobacteroides abscessus subsp. massiliense]